VKPNRSIRRVRIAVLVGATLALGLVTTGVAAAPAPATTRSASNWLHYKRLLDQPNCAGGGLRVTHFTRVDCASGNVTVNDSAATDVVSVAFYGPGATSPFKTVVASRDATDGTFDYTFLPDATWPSGRIRERAIVNGEAAAGEGSFAMNHLDGTVTPAPDRYDTGEAVPVTGSIYEVDEQTDLVAPTTKGVPATFKLAVVLPSGERRGPYGPTTALADGTFTAVLPAAATANLVATTEADLVSTLAIEIVDASYTDPSTGAWSAERAGAGSVDVHAVANGLTLENRYVSPVGWVKPGELYPFRVFVKNYSGTPQAGAVVTLPTVDGLTLVDARVLPGSGTASIVGGAVQWDVGVMPAATEAGPAIKTLIVEGRADRLDDDPQIVWKDLSSTASLTWTGAAAPVTSTSKGPKVIPPSVSFDTARFGERPFPVVPVDFFDRTHAENHSGRTLDQKINSPSVPGSTFNLYQEMSFGQLFPEGAVPSATIASADWANTFQGRYKDRGFEFTDGVSSTIGGAPLQAGGTCRGVSFKDSAGTASYQNRIVNGWYQLPGTTDYYGDDAPGSTVVLAQAGVAFGIDQACGVIGKAVYDAAHIADPEIDYSDYDTDKDGVVDFFMMVYTGLGGNGASQVSVPSYDNIWPHSFSLEAQFTDPATGLTGYVSDDQLKDLEGRPLFYVDTTYTTKTTATTPYPVYVRVGPYNVNPESAIDRASVISHEYGHSLGLPDFYSFGSRATYGDWNLMATDKSQHMDVFSKQELGWVVPREIGPGTSTVSGWKDSKTDTHQITWKQPDGAPYTLAGPKVHNAEAYVAKLPGTQVIDPAKVKAGASGKYVWWSGAQDGSGCAPEGANNLDIVLPDLANVPAGTPITMTFKSYWDIEWDFDHGFVLSSTDGGKTFTSNPSKKGYTTNENPNHSAASPISGGDCQARYGNGLTGTSGSAAAGTQASDRGAGAPGLPVVDPVYPDGGFLEDSYDLSGLAGKTSIVRFSYSTDASTTRAGWFIDDVVIKAGDKVIYSSGFEDTMRRDVRLTNGACEGAFRTGTACTPRWTRIAAEDGATPDHAYYLEMRDRSGFDEIGRGENDREAIDFDPGLLLTYTDEIRGYGNTNSTGAPAQSPLDSQPQPSNDAPDLTDASFTEAAGDGHYSDSGAGHVDNYLDPDNPDAAGQAGPWVFAYDCLTFDVLSMSGRGIGPAQLPGDLTGDVRFTRGPGCRGYDYGAANSLNGAPVAVPDAKATSVVEGDTVAFDGSSSFDDQQAARDLTYRWDFDGDGVDDATGQTPRHTFAQDGVFAVRLTVVDADGASDTSTITVRVANAAPTTVVRGPDSVVSGATARYTATVADAGVRDVHTLRWFVDGDVVPGVTGTELERTFTGGGTHLVTAAARDEIVEGAKAPAVRTVVTTSSSGAGGDAVAGGGGSGSSAGSAAGAGRPVGGAPGYRMVATDGGIFSFGSSAFFGSTGDLRLNKPIVGMASTPSGSGYWLVASDGGIFSFGDAEFFGSTGDLRLNQPIVAMAATPSGKGYWLVASDGGIFSFGDAAFFGSTGDLRLNQAIVGMSPTPSGRGYRLVARDGGIFAFGDAGFAGSTGDLRLNQPIVGMASTPSGNGYWLVATDGGIFAFGDAGFVGSAGSIRLRQPVVGMAPTGTGAGYWLVAADGGIFTFGDAEFLGSTGALTLNRPIVGMAA
jgi:M6 family metalloprotease-like protein